MQLVGLTEAMLIRPRSSSPRSASRAATTPITPVEEEARSPPETEETAEEAEEEGTNEPELNPPVTAAELEAIAQNLYRVVASVQVAVEAQGDRVVAALGDVAASIRAASHTQFVASHVPQGVSPEALDGLSDAAWSEGLKRAREEEGSGSNEEQSRKRRRGGA
jgi:hypothetical protein